MIALAAALALFAPQTPPRDTVTDRQIAAFAASKFDKDHPLTWKRELGIHHGTPVVVDYRCSDVCPRYFTRVIHYAVEPGPECDRIGGVVRIATIPRGIASKRIPYCVPAVLGTELIPLGGG